MLMLAHIINIDIRMSPNEHQNDIAAIIAGNRNGGRFRSNPSTERSPRR